ncbi:hypothetical protein [Streptomyces flavofungini]|uniref:hypothetical protein n=1 Tax=Streptomyces flavofungini TaxID=68200 RepID=UPI0025AFC611|nr:hypothetical protein [Streptomyces flavofungini]WJV50644.1 hypothetical protein QUY26_37180 [Streptomyces flavofungini]
MAHEEAADGGPAAKDTAAQAELERLRAEVEDLRARAGTERRRRSLALRRALAAILIALVAVCAVTSVIGVWGARTTLDTDRWVATVGPLPGDPDVNAAVSTYITREVFDRVDVEERVRESLPERASFLAAPVSKAARDHLKNIISGLMETERFQDLWRATNRLAHERAVALLENRREDVRVEGDKVTLNLLPLVNNSLTALESRLPTLFDKKLDLPTLSSGEIPPELHDRIEKALGVSLPDDFGQITLYDRHELGQLQEMVLLFKRAVVGLVIAVPLLLGAALWISPNRRRTLLQLGLWLVVTVTVLAGVLRGVRDQILGQVTPGVYREGVRAAMWTIFTTLRERGDQLLWLGIAVAVVAYLVGPGRLPVAARAHAARGARATARFATRVGDRISEGAGPRPWIQEHADVLRTAGIVVAALVALLLSSWSGLLTVAVVLTVYEVTVTLLAHGGSPRTGEARPGSGSETGAPPASPQQGGTA